MLIAAVAVIPTINGGFYCVESKERGLILPGGKFDSKIDNTYHDCARREAFEETGVVVDRHAMKYIWHGTDCEWITYAFWCPKYHGELTDSREGKAIIGFPPEMMRSKYRAYYACLFDILRISV